jgi:hypothetical protein
MACFLGCFQHNSLKFCDRSRRCNVGQTFVSPGTNLSVMKFSYQYGRTYSYKPHINRRALTWTPYPLKAAIYLCPRSFYVLKVGLSKKIVYIEFTIEIVNSMTTEAGKVFVHEMKVKLFDSCNATLRFRIAISSTESSWVVRNLK